MDNTVRPIIYIPDVYERAIVPGKDREEESGKYTTSYPDSSFLEAIQQLGGMAGTSEIAEEVGCTRRTAYTRLKSIEEDGRINSRKVGNSLVWSTSG
ncbi:HTH domain-containing protein [Halosimplex pelagicum]|uniref:HTH domain-containing protein n=1 Tax=Halosimplex pelagicum TaxID=869886 RepID=UPI001FED2404|nr:HTH domain-containing protein [Halosimplex pelagicum]